MEHPDTKKADGTVTDTLRRLEEAGYSDSLHAEENGMRATRAGILLLPEKLVVEEAVRFEGRTNPSDQAVVFALRCKQTGVRGTYVAAYGPQTDPRDAEVMRRLEWNR